MTIKMIIGFLVILFVGYFSWINTDLGGDSVLYSVILPFVDFLSLLFLALWVVILLHKLGVNQKDSSFVGSESGFGDINGGD